ncbi:MAG: hypothetical protein QOF98_3275, partial [Streptomyces sp.]|nr:hypothetical protein [Streptomyces sp.]
MEWYVRFTERLTVRRAEGERYLLRRRSVPVIDPSYGDARLAGIRAAATERGAEGWPGIRAELAAAAGGTGGEDGDELTFLVAGLQSVAGLERWIGEVVAAEPEDPLALLVAGARQARIPPSPEPGALFRTRLETA